jgi:hypothetical protein
MDRGEDKSSAIVEAEENTLAVPVAKEETTVTQETTQAEITVHSELADNSHLLAHLEKVGKPGSIVCKPEYIDLCSPSPPLAPRESHSKMKPEAVPSHMLKIGNSYQNPQYKFNPMRSEQRYTEPARCKHHQKLGHQQQPAHLGKTQVSASVNNPRKVHGKYLSMPDLRWKGASHPKYQQQLNPQSSASLKRKIPNPDASPATPRSSNQPFELQFTATTKWYNKAPPWINLEDPPVRRVYWEDASEKRTLWGLKAYRNLENICLTLCISKI